MAMFRMAFIIYPIVTHRKQMDVVAIITTLLMDWFFVVWLSNRSFVHTPSHGMIYLWRSFCNVLFGAKCVAHTYVHLMVGGVLQFIRIYMFFLSYTSQLNMVEWFSLESRFTSTATQIGFYYHDYHIMTRLLQYVLASLIHGGVTQVIGI